MCEEPLELSCEDRKNGDVAGRTEVVAVLVAAVRVSASIQYSRTQFPTQSIQATV
jgi:hypothetical protein